MFKVDKYLPIGSKNCGGITIPAIVLETKKFQSMMDCSPAMKLYFVLSDNVIRGKMNRPIAQLIYEEFYLKRGLLPSYYREEDLAKKLGYKSKSPVSKAKKVLVQEGFVRTVDFKFYGKHRECYILGERGSEGRPNEETVYAFDACLDNERDNRLLRICTHP